MDIPILVFGTIVSAGLVVTTGVQAIRDQSFTSTDGWIIGLGLAGAILGPFAIWVALTCERD